MKTKICPSRLSRYVSILALGGCLGAGALPAFSQADKNSFKEVTSKLDPGGNLYAYLSTEQWLDGLSAKVAGFRDWLVQIPGMGGDDRAKAEKIINFVASLVKHCGVEDISGVGISSVMKEKGLYRSKFVMHHYSGKGNGFLWTMFGTQPHAMKGLDMLPATTAIATFSDFDLPLLWTVIQKEIAGLGIPDADKALSQIPQQFEGVTGLKFGEVMASLGNEYGLVITLDDSKKITIPMGGEKGMEVPEPGILLAIKVNNDLIFNRVDELLKENPAVIKTEKQGLKMRTMPLPIPVPIDLRPSLARHGDYLLIATSDALIEGMLDVKAGKQPGLKSTDEFKRLAREMPEQGNSFSFMSERFGKTLMDVQMQALKANARGNESPGMISIFQQIFSMAPPTSEYTVAANGPEGWLSTGTGTRNPANIVFLPVAAAGGLLAGVALPAVARARMNAMPPSEAQPKGKRLGEPQKSNDGSQ